jgi:hypothetical protein
VLNQLLWYYVSDRFLPQNGFISMLWYSRRRTGTVVLVMADENMQSAAHGTKT